MNDRDSPIWQNPSYWPIAMRITPHWHYESAGKVAVNSVPGDPTSPTIEKTINTSGFDLSGIDILTAGTLAKNISFLLVPSIDPGDGTVGFESANVRFDNIANSPWLNFKFGKFELDVPLSEKRMMTLSNVGGEYQLYHFVPVGGDINDFYLRRKPAGRGVDGTLQGRSHPVRSLDDQQHERHAWDWSRVEPTMATCT